MAVNPRLNFSVRSLDNQVFGFITQGEGSHRGDWVITRDVVSDIFSARGCCSTQVMGQVVVTNEKDKFLARSGFSVDLRFCEGFCCSAITADTFDTCKDNLRNASIKVLNRYGHGVSADRIHIGETFVSPPAQYEEPAQVHLRFGDVFKKEEDPTPNPTPQQSAQPSAAPSGQASAQTSPSSEFRFLSPEEKKRLAELLQVAQLRQQQAGGGAASSSPASAAANTNLIEVSSDADYGNIQYGTAEQETNI